MYNYSSLLCQLDGNIGSTINEVVQKAKKIEMHCTAANCQGAFSEESLHDLRNGKISRDISIHSDGCCLVIT